MSRNSKDTSSWHGKHWTVAIQCRGIFLCELQLMDRFLDDDGVYNYIGCSKRSCLLCWEILAGTRFVTQGTHCTLHGACAFAFTVGHSPARQGMVKNFGEVAGYVEQACNSLASNPLRKYIRRMFL